MGKGARVTVSVCLLAAFSFFFFSLTRVALSQTESHSLPPSSKQLQVWDISVPASLGYVTETHRPTSLPLNNSSSAGPQAPIIVHIQDAHTNYEAQKNIIAILEQLIHQYGLKLVMVEGGQGDLSLSYLRQYGPGENRKQVAEKYLKAGIISAEEYLDIISDYPLTIWGVEQEDLYNQNVESFLAADALHESLGPFLASARDAVNLLRPKLMDAAVNDLESKAAAFERHALSLAEYVTALEHIAKQRSISLQGYPNLERFIEVRHIEQSIERSQVQQEQQALIGQLSHVAPGESLQDLVTKAQGMKEGSVKPVEFYAILEQLAATSKVTLDDVYPHLAQYIRYVTLSAKIKPSLLSEELETFTDHLRRKFSATPASQELRHVIDELDLVEKLLELRLSPPEYRQLSALNLPEVMAGWEQFLSDQLQRNGLPPKPFARPTSIQTDVAKLQQFYSVAAQRDEALVRNAVAKLQETKEPIAVLITGGFHSPKIVQMLNQEGIGTVLLTPKVSHPTNERLYRAVVKYKSGRGSFEEVMSIANESSTQTASSNTR